MIENNPSAILLLSCKDRKGLVSRLSNFIFERGGLFYHAQHRVLVHSKKAIVFV
jgi:formyltetrahydrofolate hydrolase